MNLRKYVCECIGTFALVLFGCGVAVFSQMNLIATALAFGLVVAAMAYTIGPVSGCHVNPAVSLAMAVTRRLKWGDFFGYVIAQVLGAVLGSSLLYAIVISTGRDPLVTGLGQNSYSAISVGGALATEVFLTFIFVLTILAVTGKNNRAGKQSGIVIGITLTLVHLLGIALTGTSVNPARSLGPALVLQGQTIEEVWVFIAAPLTGALLAAVFGVFVLSTEETLE